MKKPTPEEILTVARKNNWSIPETKKQLGISGHMLSRIASPHILREIYTNLLYSVNGNTKKAATIDGINYKNFLNKMLRYNVSVIKIAKIREKIIIEKKGRIIPILEKHNGNVSAASRELKISERTIRRYVGKDEREGIRRKMAPRASTLREEHKKKVVSKIIDSLREHFGDTRKTSKALGIGISTINQLIDRKTIAGIREQSKPQKQHDKRMKMINALHAQSWDIRAAAKSFGISIGTLRWYLNKMKISGIAGAKREWEVSNPKPPSVNLPSPATPLKSEFPSRKVYIQEFRKFIDFGKRNSIVLSKIARLKADIALGINPKYTAHKLFRYYNTENKFREQHNLPPIPKLPKDVFESTLALRKQRLWLKKLPVMLQKHVRGYR